MLQESGSVSGSKLVDYHPVQYQLCSILCVYCTHNNREVVRPQAQMWPDKCPTPTKMGGFAELQRGGGGGNTLYLHLGDEVQYVENPPLVLFTYQNNVK